MVLMKLKIKIAFENDAQYHSLHIGRYILCMSSEMAFIFVINNHYKCILALLLISGQQVAPELVGTKRL